MPFRRYQTPSRVRQTSSASILPPLDRTISGLPLLLAGPLVETGPRLVVVCEVATRVEEGVGVAVGDGEGDGDGKGEGGGGSGKTGAAATTGMFGETCSSGLVTK